MLRKIFVFVFVTALVLISPRISFAKTIAVTKSTNLKAIVKPTPSPTPVPVVNSFELFWPMSAGKTMQSKVYFLKTLKEKVRGIFIFGSAQKADYNIFLSIKRMLEAEVLMKGNVPGLANQTLDAAVSDLNKANSTLTDAKNSSDVAQDTKNEINTRVNNLKKFTNFLINKYPDFKDKLQTVLDKLNSLTV
jgi:hypothetical protein